MKNKSFTLCLLSLLLLSCKERATEHYAQHLVTIAVPSHGTTLTRQEVSISSFADSVSFIRLETTDESLIGRISQVLFLDDLVIIEDNQTHSIFFFYRCGKFSHRIARRGRGPGEYITLTRAMLDAENRRIMVYDVSSRKMLFYDLDGTFIREISQFSDGATIFDIINLPNGNFLCYNFDQYLGHQFSGLWEVDSNGVYVRTHLPPNTGYPFRLNPYNSFLYHLDDGVGLSAGDINVIYHFRQDTLTAFLSYTIQNRPSVEDARRRGYKRNRHRSHMFHSFDDYVRKSKTQEKGNWILTEWTDATAGHIGFVSVYSKRDGKVVTGFPRFDSPYFASFFGTITPSNDTTAIIVLLSPTIVSVLLEHYQHVPEINRNKLRELIYGMSEREIEDMNPIIQILHIRQ